MSTPRRATRPPPGGSRRSSSGWTPARPACARRSTSARRAAGSSSSAPASWTPSAAGWRSCASTSSSRGWSSGRPATRRRPHERPLGEGRRPAAGDRGLRLGAAAARRLQRLHARLDRPALPRRRPRGPRRGRQLRGRRPGRAAGRRRHAAAGRARGRWSPSATTSRRSTSGPSRPATTRRCSTACGPMSRRRWTSRCARRACRCSEALGREARPLTLRRLAAPRRAGDDGAAARAAGPLPGPALQARPDAVVGRRAGRRAGGDRRGRHGGLEGVVRGVGRRQPGRPGALSPRRRGLPRRVDRGPGDHRRDLAGAGALPGPHHLGRQHPQRRRHRRRCRSRRTWSTSSRRGSAACVRLFKAYEYCEDRGIAMYGGGQFELGVGRGQIQYLAAIFHPDGPNDVAPGATTTSSRRPGCRRARCRWRRARRAFAGGRAGSASRRGRRWRPVRGVAGACAAWSVGTEESERESTASWQPAVVRRRPGERFGPERHSMAS